VTRIDRAGWAKRSGLGNAPVAAAENNRFNTVKPIAVTASFCKRGAAVFHRVLVLTLFGATLLISAATNSAQATGYWNLPSTFCQCIGCGYGAGYHAPLVLGPISCEGWIAVNEHRRPHAPAPPCAGFDYGSYDFAQPTLMEPLPQPASPAPRPMSRKHRPLFLR
jgi:hypothetical protein